MSYQTLYLLVFAMVFAGMIWTIVYSFICALQKKPRREWLIFLPPILGCAIAIAMLNFIPAIIPMG